MNSLGRIFPQHGHSAHGLVPARATRQGCSPLPSSLRATSPVVGICAQEGVTPSLGWLSSVGGAVHLDDKPGNALEKSPVGFALLCHLLLLPL